MTIVNITLMGLTVLSDVGILQAIVQNERGEDAEFFDTAWTLQIVRGEGFVSSHGPSRTRSRSSTNSRSSRRLCWPRGFSSWSKA